MNKIRRVIKKDARGALKGNRGAGIGITMIAILISAVLVALEVAFQIIMEASGFVTEVINSATPWQTALQISPFYLYVTLGVALLSAVLVSPLQVGFADWGMSCTEGKKPSAGHVFWPYGCRKFFGSIILNIAIYIKSVFWFIIFFILPTALLGGGAYALYFMDMDRTYQAAAVTAVLAGGVLLIVMTMLYVVFLTRYTLARYLMGKRYGRGWFSAIRLSVRYTKGHRWETFIFGLSFLPWMILSVLILPIFFLVPYMQVSYAMYTRYLCELYETRKHEQSAKQEEEIQQVTVAEQTPREVAGAEEPQPQTEADNAQEVVDVGIEVQGEPEDK